jgi:hypothetical protein
MLEEMRARMMNQLQALAMNERYRLEEKAEFVELLDPIRRARSQQACRRTMDARRLMTHRGASA